MRSKHYATKLRQLILEYLMQDHSRTVTAKDIYEHLAACDASVSHTTIYRYLDKLVTEGRLLKNSTDGGKTACYLYEHEPDACGKHLHLRCGQCGKVTHLQCQQAENFIQHILHEHDFTLHCGSFILYGLCHSCKVKELLATKKAQSSPAAQG
jgi:Fur family ferric uptake transcriptional regulator